MINQGGMTTLCRALSGVLVVSALTWVGFAAQAESVSGQGTWETRFKGRDIEGKPVPLLVSGAPNPDLVFVYDEARNLTWQASWGEGPMNWPDAKRWAEGLSYIVGGVAVDDWALPTMTNFDGSQPCRDKNCKDSPIGDIWYNALGNTDEMSNTGPFRQLKQYCYWTGSPPVERGTGRALPEAWTFATYNGHQGIALHELDCNAVAVRRGDVAAVAH